MFVANSQSTYRKVSVVQHRKEKHSLLLVGNFFFVPIFFSVDFLLQFLSSFFDLFLDILTLWYFCLINKAIKVNRVSSSFSPGWFVSHSFCIFPIHHQPRSSTVSRMSWCDRSATLVRLNVQSLHHFFLQGSFFHISSLRYFLLRGVRSNPTLPPILKDSRKEFFSGSLVDMCITEFGKTRFKPVFLFRCHPFTPSHSENSTDD